MVTRKVAINSPASSNWYGRLSLQVESAQTPPVTAEFELTGNPETGTLTLYAPLGSTAAVLTWAPLSATLRAHNGEVEHFESLDALIRRVVGTEIPVHALFAWLAGRDMSAAGWSADLSDYAKGRITARRTQPEPAAELRVALEK